MFGRRKRHDRTFRPGLDGRSGETLEARVLLSRRPRFLGALPPALYQNPPRTGLTEEAIPKWPKPYVQTGVANGGRSAVLVDTDGELYTATLTGGGTIRARAVPGGKVDLILYGTNTESILTIDPQIPTFGEQAAHTLPIGSPFHDGLVHIRNINVTNGRVGQLLGYRTATVSGRITVQAPRPDATTPFVDRIAFYSLRPGTSVAVDGSLNTLDVYDNVQLGAGDVITTGLDLNFMYVGRDLTLTDGAAIIAGRDIGLFGQPAKGSGPGGAGVRILNDLIVGPRSTIAALREVQAGSVVFGDAIGTRNLQPEFASRLSVLGATVPVLPVLP